MAVKVIDERILEFYRRVIFGEEYRYYIPSTKIVDWTTICECCFRYAWKTMARTLLGGVASTMGALKSSMLSDLEQQVKIAKFDPHALIKKYSSSALTVGQAQKVINMFYKFLYTFLDELLIVKSAKNIFEEIENSNPMDEYGGPCVVGAYNKSIFDDCDCPIDRVILKSLRTKNIKINNVEIKSNGMITYTDTTGAKITVPWSRLTDYNVYIEIQNAIEDYQKANSGGSKLDYDFNNW